MVTRRIVSPDTAANLERLKAYDALAYDHISASPTKGKLIETLLCERRIVPLLAKVTSKMRFGMFYPSECFYKDDLYLSAKESAIRRRVYAARVRMVKAMLLASPKKLQLIRTDWPRWNGMVTFD